MKKYILKSQANHIQEFPAIVQLIAETTDKLSYPIEATDTGKVGDMETPIVRLSNGNTVNVYYFEYEEI